MSDYKNRLAEEALEMAVACCKHESARWAADRALQTLQARYMELETRCDRYHAALEKVASNFDSPFRRDCTCSQCIAKQALGAA